MDAADEAAPLEDIFKKDEFNPAADAAGPSPGESLGAVLKSHLGAKTRPARRKPAGAAREPELEIATPIGEYAPGTIGADIRRLRAVNPQRSIAWIAKQVGQPRSRVLSALEDAP